jgi:phenylacetate-CoA ligase
VVTAAQRPTGKLTGDACAFDPILDRAAECMSDEDLRTVSNAKWARHAADVETRSPFYRRHMKAGGVRLTDAASLTDLPRLPLTTKDDLRKAQDAYPPFGDYLGVDPAKLGRIYQTSGTSGVACLIGLTHHDIQKVWGRIQSRSYYACGIHPHSRVVVTFGAGPFVAGSTHRVLENLGSCTVPVAPGDSARVIATMRAGIVDTMQGTPTFALYLAQHFEKNGIDARAFSVTHIITGGEPGGGIPTTRRVIEEAFGADVTEIYGLGDISPSLFGECPEGGGLHFCGQELVWCELIDPVTEMVMPIEPGAVGELVYTSLEREAMPLVRYRSGDIVEIQPGPCACGRTSFRMRCVGRSDDMFIVRGVNVYPSAIHAVVSEFRPRVTGRIRVRLKAGQVAVDPPVPVDVEVADLTMVDAALAEKIETTIRGRLVFRPAVRFVSQDDFGDAGYKTRLVARN